MTRLKQPSQDGSDNIPKTTPRLRKFDGIKFARVGRYETEYMAEITARSLKLRGIKTRVLPPVGGRQNVWDVYGKACDLKTK